VRVHGRQILDSRGNPTVEVELELDDGSLGRAAVPSGASTGTHEALELRDGEARVYGGKGVLRAIDNVNRVIAPRMVGFSPFDQAIVDQALIDLDGTESKSRLGANAPALPGNAAAIGVVLTAIEGAGYRAGEDVLLGLDVAASELYRDGRYVLARDGQTLSAEELVTLYGRWVRQYPIASIEDGL